MRCEPVSVVCRFLILARHPEPQAQAWLEQPSWRLTLCRYSVELGASLGKREARGLFLVNGCDMKWCLAISISCIECGRTCSEEHIDDGDVVVTSGAMQRSGP